MRRLSDRRWKLNYNSAFFKIFREKDTVILDEVYALCKRQPNGRRFIQGRLYEWKKKGLVEPVYQTHPYPYPIPQVLKGVKLTSLGKSYFHRVLPQSSVSLTAEELLKIVIGLQKRHPKIGITFELRLKRTSALTEAIRGHSLKPQD
jgi:hypothetical protein